MGKSKHGKASKAIRNKMAPHGRKAQKRDRSSGYTPPSQQRLISAPSGGHHRRAAVLH